MSKHLSWRQQEENSHSKLYFVLVFVSNDCEIDIARYAIAWRLSWDQVSYGIFALYLITLFCKTLLFDFCALVELTFVTVSIKSSKNRVVIIITIL